VPALSDAEIAEALTRLPEWDLEQAESRVIVTRLRFADFRRAVAFVVQVAFEAEAADHHPDVDIRYNQLRIALSTHSEGGVTGKDLALAAAIDRLADR